MQLNVRIHFYAAFDKYFFVVDEIYCMCMLPFTCTHLFTLMACSFEAVCAEFVIM